MYLFLSAGYRSFIRPASTGSVPPECAVISFSSGCLKKTPLVMKLVTARVVSKIDFVHEGRSAVVETVATGGHPVDRVPAEQAPSHEAKS